MAAVPQAAFAVKKVKQNQELKNSQPDSPLLNYNSKYMNSIWGMYNRYSCHNLKMNQDAVTESLKGSIQENSSQKNADNKGSRYLGWGQSKYM